MSSGITTSDALRHHKECSLTEGDPPEQRSRAPSADVLAEIRARLSMLGFHHALAAWVASSVVAHYARVQDFWYKCPLVVYLTVLTVSLLD